MKYLKINNHPSSMLNGEDWGSCEVYLQFNDKHRAIAQMEFHTNGKKLHYHLRFSEDKYSVLLDMPLYDENGNFLQGKHDYEFITAEEFNQLWIETIFDNPRDEFDE
jgi:hypothetical protein